MARKSRRNAAKSQAVSLALAPGSKLSASQGKQSKIRQLRTAAYARISREKEDEETVKTQVELLHRFIDDSPGLSLAATYIDHGVSGTTFNRPEFNRMMEDVYHGVIQCIVVKDLSRFGRNMIETGYYIEMIFPKLDVRFIAVTDRFDSSRREDRESIAIPIRNMINDFYARDFSKKQVASFELHSRLGDRKILSTPYGYDLDQRTNTMIPNEETAPVVQLIFRWFLLGVGVSEIAHRLNDLGVPSPREYKVRRGFGGKSCEAWAKDRLWSYTGVRNVLRNRVYIGDWVLGKNRSAQYKSIKSHRTSPKEWIIHKERHKAVVSASDFEAVQESFEKSKYKMKSKKKRFVYPNENMFHRKVRCLECGRTMLYHRKNYGNRRNTGAVYQCYAANRSGDTSTTGGVRRAGKRYHGSLNVQGKRRDCGRQVNEDYVKLVVMDALGSLSTDLCRLRPVVVRFRQTASGGRLKDIQKEICRLNKRLDMIRKRKEGLYGDYVGGLLKQEDYLFLKEHYVDEEREAEEHMIRLKEKQRHMDRVLEQFLRWTDRLSELEGRALERSVVEEVIEYVGFGADEKTEVVFTFREVFEETLEIIGEAVKYPEMKKERKEDIQS